MESIVLNSIVSIPMSDEGNMDEAIFAVEAKHGRSVGLVIDLRDKRAAATPPCYVFIGTSPTELAYSSAAVLHYIVALADGLTLIISKRNRSHVAALAAIMIGNEGKPRKAWEASGVHLNGKPQWEAAKTFLASLHKHEPPRFLPGEPLGDLPAAPPGAFLGAQPVPQLNRAVILKQRHELDAALQRINAVLPLRLSLPVTGCHYSESPYFYRSQLEVIIYQDDCLDYPDPPNSTQTFCSPPKERSFLSFLRSSVPHFLLRPSA